MRSERRRELELVEVTIRAGVRCSVDVIRCVISREEGDKSLVPERATLAAELDGVSVGKAPVENENIVSPRREELPRLRESTGGVDDDPAPLLQEEVNGTDDLLVVLHEQKLDRNPHLEGRESSAGGGGGSSSAPFRHVCRADLDF